MLLAELGATRAKARHWLGTPGPLNRICSQGSPTAGGTTSGSLLRPGDCLPSLVRGAQGSDWTPDVTVLLWRCHSEATLGGRSLILSRINHLAAKCPVHPSSLQQVE